jgi:hypothetical protein
MHRSRDIRVGIFEPRDWVYFQALPSWAWADICQKLVQTPFFMVLNTGIPVLRKFKFKNLQKSTSRPRIKNSGRTPGRYIVLSLSSNFQLSRCRNVEKVENRQTDGQTVRGTTSIEHIFLKTCSKFFSI